MASIVVVMAQVNTRVGDIEYNTQLVIDSVRQAETLHQANIIVFPELTLCGYPPEDLLLRPSMDTRIQDALNQLKTLAFSAAIVLGYPKLVNGNRFNLAGVIHNGDIVLEYAKQELPNYQVFDEKRYFSAGDSVGTFTYESKTIAVTVCEDIWHEAPMLKAKAAGADLMINLNASPYHRFKHEERIELLSERAQQGEMPIIYVNQIGGQDELVFDGGSFVTDASGELIVQAPYLEEGLFPVSIHLDAEIQIAPQPLPETPEVFSRLYQVLVLGVRDYVNKNGFKHVILGLSGGIDSALTLAIAVDALGAERVTAVMMPFRYTSDMSQNDAAEQAQRMGVDYQSISIEPMYDAFMGQLAESFANKPVDLTEQNLQARCRGVVLMAISNKTGALVLTTGNKSEMAVGYSTLYGDMAGGFDVLKDVPKTLVFALSKYRNTVGAVIPENVITRPPSAELAPDQVDEDNLPPYDILDQILEGYIERDESAEALISQGFDKDTVYRVIRLVDLNEYKRRQAPVGIRISKRGFGRDRRYPITNGWKAGK